MLFLAWGASIKWNPKAHFCARQVSVHRGAIINARLQESSPAEVMRLVAASHPIVGSEVAPLRRCGLGLCAGGHARGKLMFDQVAAVQPVAHRIYGLKSGLTPEDRHLVGEL
jgi:hypothetical protein